MRCRLRWPMPTPWRRTATETRTWARIVMLYEGLLQIARSRGGRAQRAVAVAMAPSSPADRKHGDPFAQRTDPRRMLVICAECERGCGRSARATEPPMSSTGRVDDRQRRAENEKCWRAKPLASWLSRGELSQYIQRRSRPCGTGFSSCSPPAEGDHAGARTFSRECIFLSGIMLSGSNDSRSSWRSGVLDLVKGVFVMGSHHPHISREFSSTSTEIILSELKD